MLPLKLPAAARDAYAMFTKAPPVMPFEQRWSVWGGGLRRFADHRWQCDARLQYGDLERLRHRGWRRLSHLAVHGCRFCTGRRRHQFQCRGQRLRAFRSVPGRRIHSSHGWPGLHLGRTRLWLAGHHHQSHRDRGRHRSTPRAVRRQCVFGTSRRRLSFCRAWIGGIGITPYAAAQFTTFDLPGYAEQAIVGSNVFALAYNAKDVTDTPQRARPSHRQILCDDGRHSHAARTLGLGA